MSQIPNDHDPRVETGDNSEQKGGITRRQVLAGAAGAAVGLAGSMSAQAQITGVAPRGGVEFTNRPLGSLNYLDRNEYIHNMEIISYTPGVTFSAGEPLMNMYAKGRQRLIPANGGWLDISEPRNPVRIETADSGRGCVAYNTNLKKWIKMRPHGAPITGSRPEYPRGQYHPEEVARSTGYDGLRGISTWDITDPFNPVLLDEFGWPTGKGTHHNWYDGGRYAYLSAGWDDQFLFENTQRVYGSGLMIVDLSDPANVREVSRFHIPGQRIGEEEEYMKYWWAGDNTAWNGSHCAASAPRRVEDGARFIPAEFGHYGFAVLDLEDITQPKLAAQLQYDHEVRGSIPYHTLYPIHPSTSHPQLNNMIVALPEPIQADCREEQRLPRMIDMSDPYNPKVVGLFPRPKAPENAPYADFCMARGRFGTHNCQPWLAPGEARPEFFACAWFVAGIRIHDLTNPREPREVAWFVPGHSGDIEDYDSYRRGTSENAQVEWDRNLIWLSTHAGTYCLSAPFLGEPVLEPRAIERWSAPHCNVGWDDATPTAFHFGRSSRFRPA